MSHLPSLHLSGTVGEWLHPLFTALVYLTPAGVAVGETVILMTTRASPY